MDRERALRKLRACLRLSKSANAHEAAAALRQAQKLMTEHGLSGEDAGEAEQTVHRAKTRNRGGCLPVHIWWLADICAKAFGCEQREGFTYGTGAGRFHRCRTFVEFVGKNADPEIASYAFSVLRRQIERGIQKETCRLRKRKNKANRAHSFGVGFVLAIEERLVPRAPVATKEVDAASTDSAGPAAEGSAKTKRKAKFDWAAWQAVQRGRKAGASADLHSGMKNDPLALEHLP